MKKYKYYSRAFCPHGFWGKRVLREMNSEEHSTLPMWALSILDDLPLDAKILDVGCGGGANIQRMLQRFPQCAVTGIDHSTLAIDLAYQLNYDYMMMNRSIVMETSLEDMVLGKDCFDLVTLFEMVYYLMPISSALKQIVRVLKPGGTLLIANELDGRSVEHQLIELKTARRVRVFTVDELQQALSDVGFSNIKVSNDMMNHFVCITCEK